MYGRSTRVVHMIRVGGKSYSKANHKKTIVFNRIHHVSVRIYNRKITEPGVVADRSRLQEGYRSMGRGKGRFQGARKRAGS